MARMECKFPKDLLEGLDVDALCSEILENASPVMVESMKKSARASILHEGESEMVNSIKASKPKKTKRGAAYVVYVEPTGYSKSKIYYDVKTREKANRDVFKSYKHRKLVYKVSNALKAIWKEYGIAGHQAPRPFIARAVRDAEAKAVEKMQEAYNRKVGGG